VIDLKGSESGGGPLEGMGVSIMLMKCEPHREKKHTTLEGRSTQVGGNTRYSKMIKQTHGEEEKWATAENYAPK